MNVGVGSFVLSECSEAEILEALSEMLQGKDFMCGKIVDFLTSPAGALKSTRCEGMVLTDREMDILKLIAEGHSNKQMADLLFLSPHTINTHRKNIMAKLQVNNTAGLVMYAVKENLLDRNKFLFS
jgi:DNA-binding NarL/FixJ family response regulator